MPPAMLSATTHNGRHTCLSQTAFQPINIKQPSTTHDTTTQTACAGVHIIQGTKLTGYVHACGVHVFGGGLQDPAGHGGHFPAVRGATLLDETDGSMMLANKTML